eukprot:10786935-Alexandrium_andersonii.AAC.1
MGVLTLPLRCAEHRLARTHIAYWFSSGERQMGREAERQRGREAEMQRGRNAERERDGEMERAA